MMLAALLALVVQSFVVQTHVHIQHSPTLLSEVGQAAGASSVPHRRAHLPGALDCSACRQLARAGSVVLPTSIVLIASVVAVERLSFREAAPIAAIRRSHRWRSRAPPAALTA